MKVKKAVIPAAGFGTRVLPVSKAMPKEMLPIVDRPAIEWIVAEAVRSGIRDILIVTGRGKTTVEDHFDRNELLEQRLLASGRKAACRELIEIAAMANIHYIRQQQMLGLGHAVLCAKAFVGDEPFAVMYGDDVIVGDNPATAQLCEAWDRYGKGVAGIRQVSAEQISRYSSLKLEALDGAYHKITDMIEKPAPGEEFTNYSILGRCVLPPRIFDILEHTPKGAGGEIQLTDAMRTLMLEQGMIGVEYEGIRYDMGNKLSYMQANVEQALCHAEIGEEFRAWLLELMGTLS